MMTIDENGNERPQCVLCLTVMARESMKPSKLKRHLKTENRDRLNDTVEMFGIREERYRLSGTLASHGFRLVEKADIIRSFTHRCGTFHETICIRHSTFTLRFECRKENRPDICFNKIE